MNVTEKEINFSFPKKKEKREEIMYLFSNFYPGKEFIKQYAMNAINE